LFTMDLSGFQTPGDTCLADARQTILVCATALCDEAPTTPVRAGGG